MNNMTDETFQAYTGVEKRFSVDGKTLVVPARLDTFITYRTNFRKLAKSCSDNALQEYKTSVNDLDTFMEHLPQIYQKHLDIIAGKAIDILIAEGVYDYSVETFTERHMASFCNTLNDYQTMQQNIEETQEENYGVKSGIAKGLGSFLTRNSSNFVKSFVDGATDSFADGSEKLTNDQKAELYQHIILRELFNDIFSDYWNTVITMVEILRENLHDIWLFDSGEVNDIGIIIQNIKNPNFPQDKIVDILFDYILKKPNEERVYKIWKIGTAPQKKLPLFWTILFIPISPIPCTPKTIFRSKKQKTEMRVRKQNKIPHSKKPSATAKTITTHSLLENQREAF